MVDVKETEMWLKSIFNINRELDFQRMVVSDALQRIEHLEKVLAEQTEKYNERRACKEKLGQYWDKTGTKIIENFFD